MYYLGEADKQLPPGVYNFFFQYSAEDLIEKLPNMKRLTLEVTGSSPFPVLASSVTIRLPRALQEENVTYKGYIETPALHEEDPRAPRTRHPDRVGRRRAAGFVA